MNRKTLSLRTLVTLAPCLALLVAFVACGSASPTDPGSQTLGIEDLVVGTGAAVVSGDTVTVNYIGTLTNGTKFDSSYDRGVPHSFRVGAGQVIAGWDQGLPGMKVGGKRRLTIPPSLGYGSSGAGAIPGNATIVFEIDLLSITGK